MGWDMRSGLETAKGSTLVVIDGDGQNPVEDVLRMYEEMERTGVDVCKGRRVVRDDGPYRRLLSAVYNLLFRVLFRTGDLADINAKRARDARRPAVGPARPDDLGASRRISAKS